ncbi:MAG TPA: hypothetical protein VGF13_07560 [Verrucomicrobiae bacterium]|jgi:hypothetical protein
MKTQLVPNIRRQGFTYLTTVITLIVVGIMLGAYLKMVSVQNQLTVRSQTWNRSIPILEAGIDEAVAHLNKNGAPDDFGVVDLAKLSNFTDGWVNDGAPALTGPWHKTGSIDGDIYWVSISAWNGSTASFPTISSTGYVRNLPAFAWKRLSGPFLAASLLDSGYFSKRMVECSVTNNPTFTKAIVAKHGIDMNGNNIYTDSYDSGIAGRNISNHWAMSVRRDHGDIGSNDTITNSITIGNANIWGRVATGPRGTVSIGSGGKVGDAAWQGGSVSGIQPGFSSDDMNVEFQDANPPDGSAGWVPFPGSGPLPTGNYLVQVVNSDITIAPGARVRIRVDTDWRFSGSEALTLGSNASVKIYLNCPSADLTGRGVVNVDGIPGRCQIYGSTRLTDLNIGGNGEMSAVVNAPYANINLNGGGGGPQDFSGALVGNSFKLNGHYRIHYDEALGVAGAWRGFTITSWNER